MFGGVSGGGGVVDRRQPGKRVEGIEPSSLAWKAIALPLSYTRVRSYGPAMWPCLPACASAGWWLPKPAGVGLLGLFVPDGGRNWPRKRVAEAWDSIVLFLLAFRWPFAGSSRKDSASGHELESGECRIRTCEGRAT